MEVRPESDYYLFVRFRDGLTRRVRLQESDMHGVLAPLRDAQFFEQVYVDCGAVAWPGNIDLAFDAMYAQVAGKRDRQLQAS